MSAKKARYCIGELSTLCNIPQKTLRYYDEIGLFTPDYRDDSTHYRYYSKSQIVNLMIIKTLKQMGFPLKDIRQIISENDAQSLEANINSHLETMRDDIMKRIDGQKFTIQRSKGLGENDPEMMWLTTMSPESRRLIKVLPTDVQRTAEVFDLLLGDNLQGRKEHIAEHGAEYLDDLDVS